MTDAVLKLMDFGKLTETFEMAAARVARSSRELGASGTLWYMEGQA